MKAKLILAISGIFCGFLITMLFYEEPIDMNRTYKRRLKAMPQKKSIPNSSGQKILCWIVTHPDNHQKKAIHVLQTWGHRCDRLVFMSSWNDSSLPGVVPLPVQEGREHLWRKTKASLRYLRAHFLTDYDWFFKADDDTYAILENMHLMLQSFDSSLPFYLGCRFKPFHQQGYVSGGAGYLLSRAALQIITDDLDDERLCPADEAVFEDVALGQCAANVGVITLDIRDERGALLFHPYSPELHVNPAAMNQSDKKWLEDFAWTPINKGMDCCSTNAVSFHYIEPAEMYSFDYLVYRLKPYGLTHWIKKPRKRKSRFKVKSRKELQAPIEDRF